MTHHQTRPGDAAPTGDRRQESYPPVPLCWQALTEQERSDQLRALQAWIGWLGHCYSLDHRIIPPCWAQHGALLEELAALWTAWRTVYTSTSSGTEPLAWHAQFAASRQRLTDWVAKTGCRNGEHRPGKPWRLVT